MTKRLRVTVDGKSYDVVVELPQEDGAPGAPSPILAPSAPPPAPVAAPASVATPPPSAPHPAAAPAAGDIPSPMSGRVTAVIVQVGQTVKEGDHLVTLEAMKMNTFVFAPRGGKVLAVKIEPGTVVEEGQALVTLG